MSICCCSLAGTAACRNCRNNDNAGTDYHVSFSDKPITNADRIRVMSDEELARFISFQVQGREYAGISNTRYNHWLKWLKQEEEE